MDMNGRDVIYIYIYSYVIGLYFIFLECVNYPLALKTGGYWNKFQDSFVESSHT